MKQHNWTETVTPVGKMRYCKCGEVQYYTMTRSGRRWGPAASPCTCSNHDQSPVQR